MEALEQEEAIFEELDKQQQQQLEITPGRRISRGSPRRSLIGMLAGNRIGVCVCVCVCVCVLHV